MATREVVAQQANVVLIQPKKDRHKPIPLYHNNPKPLYSTPVAGAQGKAADCGSAAKTFWDPLL